MDAFSNRANALEKILGGGVRVHPAVDEAHEVGKIMVAEESNHFPTAYTNAQRGGQFVRVVRHSGGVTAESGAQCPPQHTFISGKPLEPQIGRQGKSFIRYGALGRPKPIRRLPKNSFVIAARSRELF